MRTKTERDNQGSHISIVRMDANLAYFGIPQLLQQVINKGDEKAWNNIRLKIDYMYNHIDKMLKILDKNTSFLKKTRDELRKGKTILFKPNLVSPANINPITHGSDLGHTACTDWSFIAALMRWFHDILPVPYSRISLGEAASVSSMVAGMYNHVFKPKKKITTEAVFEGRSGDFYGGWGFYFVRKYLQDSNKDPDDNPMLGYEASVEGVYHPPGNTQNRLMVYDLNKLNDIEGKARTVKVKNGVNYKEITLPKAIIGGDPNDPEDLRDYPGAILVNVPRLKLHGIDLLTNAIKNLGIGLYPMEIGESGKQYDTHWKYSYPYKKIPGMKTEIPHSVWVPEFNPETGLPKKTLNGTYQLKKTGGIAATQADVIEATLDQGVYILHIVDGIESININHTGDPSAKAVPEGLAVSSEDPVALDLLCARYIFKNVPLKEARKAGLGSEFIQKIPLPSKNGENIITGEGYDSPLLRYNLYKYAEVRGLGSQKYQVEGWDETEKKPFCSLNGHLGTFSNSDFKETITQEFYYNPTNLLWGLQRTAFKYLEINDLLSNTNYYEQILNAYDEDGDGWLNYDEMGKDAFWHTYLRLAAFCYHLRGHSLLGALKSGFLLNSLWRYTDCKWNSEGHDFMKNFKMATGISIAYALSKTQKKNPDPFHNGRTWGEGYWPSMDFVGNLSVMTRVFGQNYPNQVSINSLYGYAFQYADKKQLDGFYTGSAGQNSDPESIKRYISDVENKDSRLTFTVYVPKGYGKMGELILPNLKETENPSKIFTAEFPDEKWII